MSEFIAGAADINQAAEPQLITQRVEDNAFHRFKRSREAKPLLLQRFFERLL